MDLAIVGIIGIIVLLAVMFVLGMPVSFAMAVVGFFGFAYVVSFHAALNMIAADLWSTFSKYGLTVIPLFIFMGYLAFNAGIAERLYDAAYKWMGHWRGGLAMATIGADEMFAAICGSNTATAATMGAVALPQMEKYNYDARLSSVGAGGDRRYPGYGDAAQRGAHYYRSADGAIHYQAFSGRHLPALLLGLLFVVTIVVLCRIYPEFGPAGPKTSLKEKIKALTGVFEALTIFVLVIGGLYVGIFTPTEAGAVGVFLTLVVRRCPQVTWKGLMNSIGDTLKISCMVFMLVTGAIIFGRFLAVTRLPFMVADFAAALPVSRYAILALVLIIYLIGGCFMDALGFLVLTIPIFFPLGVALGFDPIWYAILLTMVTTMGRSHPRWVLNIYVVKALAPDIKLGTIFHSVSFFLVACIISIIILILFPQALGHDMSHF